MEVRQGLKHPFDGLSGGASDENSYKSDDEISEEAVEENPVTERDIKFVFDVIKKEAPCDETAIKQLWYQNVQRTY